jgi:hypothetical protein
MAHYRVLEAHTTPDKRRHLDCLAIFETCPDGSVALQRYRHLHQQYPLREFYFVHTSHAELEIHERVWLGVRRSHAANAVTQQQAQFTALLRDLGRTSPQTLAATLADREHIEPEPGLTPEVMTRIRIWRAGASSGEERANNR